METSNSIADKHIVIFDGVCNFCNASVNFIIRHDKKALFSFTPLQSKIGQELITKYNIDSSKTDSLILIKNGKAFLKTDAALELAKALAGFWFLFYAFKIMPRVIRDYFYDLFAAKRYKLFGKKDVCMIPTIELRK